MNAPSVGPADIPGREAACKPGRRRETPSLRLSALATLLALFVTGEVYAGPASPLADHPSEPGPHIERIRILGDNAWLNLGKPKPDPTYGPAQGRTWSRKMAFAPDLRGAFLYGEGVHGASTRRGGQRYYNDDLFFYDINAHAWVCSHPGTPLDDPGLSYDDQCGCERDRNGNPIPVAVSVHAYWTPEYDIRRGMFTMMPSPASLYWTPALGEHRPYFTTDDERERKSDPRWCGYGSPWFWDPKTGAWKFRRVDGAAPGCNVDNTYFYSRGLDRGVNLRRGVWLYDYVTNTWEKVNAAGGGNGAYCYDPKRDWIYALRADAASDGRNRLSIYDIGENTWINPDTTGDPGKRVESNRAFFTFDTANDVAVLHLDGRHHIYDPDNRTWTVMPNTLSESIDWSGSSGFYDEALNAHFYFNAGDSAFKPGDIWVYRVQRRP